MAEIVFFIIDFDMNLPFIMLFMPTNSFYAGGIVLTESYVSHVALVSSVAEIIYSIIRFISVNMVYFMLWEIAVNVEPS